MADDVAGDVDPLDKIATAISQAVNPPHNNEAGHYRRLVHGIIAEAARLGASAIHLEPDESGLVVGMRIDGLLSEKLRMPVQWTEKIMTIIREMASLEYVDSGVPQEGMASLTLGNNVIDLRVSTLPGRATERVVMQILEKEGVATSLDLLGLSDEARSILTEALSEPNGIILVAGPGKSGKTTTLYACLKQLNDGSRNILTIEDPVEDNIEGIGQTQVNAQVGLTFAAGLRAILRQDPDVVMVGEIGDEETSHIAIKAALTDQLVLSSVQTSDAVSAITLMRDMKVEPFLLASTVKAVIAQRLVHRLCEHCRKPVQADGSLASLLGFDRGTVVFEATGCSQCDDTGYRGYIGVFEAIRIGDTIQKLISEGGDGSRIAGQAFLKNKSLAAAARAFVREGIIPAEEGIRISRG